jgi:hypothetical protein
MQPEGGKKETKLPSKKHTQLNKAKPLYATTYRHGSKSEIAPLTAKQITLGGLKG